MLSLFHRRHSYAGCPPPRPGSRAFIILCLMVVPLLLQACDFGRQAPTPVPFTPPTYAPTFATPAPAVESQPVATPAQVANLPPLPAAQTGPVAAFYNGEVEADDEVLIVAEVGGQVLELNLNVGDRVSAGQIIMRLDTTALEAQRAQALAGLEAAQAQVDLLNIRADEADIEAARAAVAAADAAYKRALEGPTAEEITMAQAQLRQAEASVRLAQAAYDQVSWNPLVAALPESLQLQQATLSLEAAQAQYEKLLKGATEDVIAGAYAQLASARAQLRRLEDGAEPAQIRAAEAQVRQAETALFLAQLQLDKATVRAPITGIVSRVQTSVGAMVTPGTTIGRVLSPVINVIIRVEETRISQIRIGQSARIRLAAFPDRVLDGTVILIAPELDIASRTVRVTVRPSGDVTGISPGMFATVELLPE